MAVGRTSFPSTRLRSWRSIGVEAGRYIADGSLLAATAHIQIGRREQALPPPLGSCS